MVADETDIQAEYEEAARWQESKRYPEAKAAYEKVLANQPDHIHAQLGYARTLLANEELSEAQEFLEGVVPDATDGRLAGELGRAYYSQAVYDKAVDVLQRATDMLPEDGHIMANYGFALWENQQREQALDVLKTALPLIQDDTTLSANMGQIYLQLGMWNEAVSSIERYLLDHPNDLDRRVALAFALSEAGWADEAETVLEEVLTIDTSFEKATELLVRIRSQASGAPEEVGAPPEAEHRVVQMQPLDIDFGMDEEKEAEPAVDVAEDLSKPAAEVDAAFADFGDVRILDEQSEQSAVVQSLMDMIAPYVAEENIAEAIEVLAVEHATSEHPAEVMNLVGKLQIDVEDYDAAVQAFRAAIEEDPFHAQAHSNLGVLLWQLGDFDDALEILQTAIQLDTEDMDARINLAMICHQVALHEEAAALYKQYVDQFPEDTKVRMALADCLSQLGETEAAIREFDTVLLLEPDNEDAQSRYDELSAGGQEPAGPA